MENKVTEVFNGLYKTINGKKMYKGVDTDNGYYYKDYDAWSSGIGVCYIPEYNFNENGEEEWISGENGYTKNDFIRLVAEKIPNVSMDIIENIAYGFFDMCEWISPETYIDAFDFEEELIENHFYEGREVYFAGNGDGEKHNFIDCHFKIVKAESLDDFTLENIHTNKIVNKAVMDEIFTISDSVCPKCGERLANEHYNNTESKYPFACLFCDENFFSIEV